MAQPGEHYRIRDEVRSVDLPSIDDAVHRWRQLGREVAEIRDDLDRARNALMDPSGGWSGDGAVRFSESIDAARTTAGRVAATAIEGIVDDSGSAFENSDPDRNMVHQLSQLREDVEFLCQDRVCPSPLPDKPWHDYPTWTWGESHKYAGPFEWGHKYRVKRNGEVIREYSPEEAQLAASAIGASSPDGLSGEQIDRLLEYLGFNDAEYQTTVQTHGDVASRFTDAATSLPAMPRRTPWEEFAGGEYPSGGGGSPSGGGGGSPGGGGGSTPSAPSSSPTGPMPDGYPGDGNGTGDPGQHDTGDDGTDIGTDGTDGTDGADGTDDTGDGGTEGADTGTDGSGGSDGTGTHRGGDLGSNGAGEQPAATDGNLWDEDDWAGAGVAAAGGVGGPGSSLAGIGGGSGGVPTTAGATNPGGLAAGAGGTAAGAGAAARAGGGATGTGGAGAGAAGRGLTGGTAGSPGMAGAGGAAGRGGIAPMMPMGAGGAGSGDGEERATWLEEDRDVWGLDDDTTPPPVIE